jgi:hypothetical protein
MIGNIIVFAVATSLVATYMLIVNRLLRSDENWNERAVQQTPSQHPTAARANRPQTRHGSFAIN